MRKLIILTGVTVILGGGYVFYDYYSSSSKKDIWDFIPENSLFVYETPDVVRCYDQVKSTGLGEGVRQLDLWNGVSNVLSAADSNINDYSIGQVLKNTQVLISIHVAAKKELDAVCYVNMSKAETSESIQEYINKLIKNTRSTLTTRTFNNRLIFEIVGAGGELQFSYFTEDRILAISRTPFLIEDVIRTIDSDGTQSFKHRHAKALKANKLKNDQGDLYINTTRPDLFFGGSVKKSGIGELVHSTFLDVKVADDMLSLSGFTYVQNKSLLSTMKDQKAIRISIHNYVPNTAYSIFHTGISDAESWYDSYRKQSGFESPGDLWDTHRMTRWMGEELVLVRLNSRYNHVHGEGKLLFIDTKDVNGALNQINTLSEDVSVNSQDTVYYENYGGIVIKELNISEFPEKLFGKPYHGFSLSYYAIVDKYLVLASDTESMRTLINSIEQENTWGRTLTKSQWLSHTLEEGNLSYFFDYRQAGTILKNALNNTWKLRLQANDQVMKGIGMGAIQFSNIDGQFYTSAVLEYDPKKIESEPLNFYTESTTYLQHNAITKPFVVRNHNTAQFREVVVQDSPKNIYLIDHKGTILWQDSIGRSINEQLYQIDYYKNKKLQYLFAAGQLIYLLDRDGNLVEGYPVDAGVEICKLSVFDYDHTKNYRILVADKKGNLFMYDKEGVRLEGWKPIDTGEALLATPSHIRVRGKDAIVVVHTNGKVSVMNRKGEMFGGFPIDLKNNISGDVHISIGRDFAHTVFSTVSKEGELTQFDLNGQVVNKKQLYKPARDTFFELVEGVIKKNFVIMRQNIFRLSLLDAKGNTIIEKDYLTTHLRKLQYYDLGDEDNIYVVNDFVQGLGYIYNYEGKLLNNVPIDNEHEIGLLKNTEMNKTFIYAVYKDQVNIYSFPL